MAETIRMAGHPRAEADVPREAAPRVALVTGASRGIGRGCAIALAAAGADVVVNYCSHREDGERVVREIEAIGRQALLVQADVARRDDVRRLIDEGVARFGRLDAVVANAARETRAPFLEMAPEEFEHTVAVTLTGTFHTCQLAAQQLARQGGGGSITAVGSVHAAHPFAQAAAYNAAKAGVNHLIRSMANELAAHRIRVNVVEPGWIDTPGERELASEEEIAAGARRLPWGRLGTPSEVGAVVAFLASPAAAYVSGAVVRVDGALMTSLEHAGQHAGPGND
jgi:glucose 1-dehydrogenase